jgi:hypothetical protein
LPYEHCNGENTARSPWLALLLVITVVNVGKQARRRQAARG